MVEWRTRSSILLTVFSSFLFSLYVVFLMNNADHEEKLDIPLLCGTCSRSISIVIVDLCNLDLFLCRLYWLILFDNFVAGIFAVTFHKMGAFRVAEHVPVVVSVGRRTVGDDAVASFVVVVGRVRKSII